MKKKIILGLALLILSYSFSYAQSQRNPCYNTGTTNCIPVGTATPLPVTGPSIASTTIANSTIAITNTFQQVLVSSVTRKSCIIQNTGNHTQYFYFGNIANATINNSFQVSPLGSISCSNFGATASDAVNITGTAGDGYVVANQ